MSEGWGEGVSAPQTPGTSEGTRIFSLTGACCCLTCSPVPEMLLKLKNLKPLRVYGEAIETMEYPYPGSNRHLSRKALRDAKPNRGLR